MEKRKCPVCNRSFWAKSPRAKYCSPKCRGRAFRFRKGMATGYYSEGKVFDRLVKRWLKVGTP